MTHRWQIVEIKRDWIPEWLFAILCIASGPRRWRRWMLVQPFRWILFRKEKSTWSLDDAPR